MDEDTIRQRIADLETLALKAASREDSESLRILRPVTIELGKERKGLQDQHPPEFFI